MGIEKVQVKDGDQFVRIPPELGWNEHTILEFSISDDGSSVILKAKNEWTVEEVQEYLEQIIDDVANNKVVHHIEYNGKKFVIAPIDENSGLFTNNG